MQTRDKMRNGREFIPLFRKKCDVKSLHISQQTLRDRCVCIHMHTVKTDEENACVHYFMPISLYIFILI